MFLILRHALGIAGFRSIRRAGTSWGDALLRTEGIGSAHGRGDRRRTRVSKGDWDCSRTGPRFRHQRATPAGKGEHRSKGNKKDSIPWSLG
ncbi:hypothetical protein PLACP1_16030 [Planifilum fimeticola]